MIWYIALWGFTLYFCQMETTCQATSISTQDQSLPLGVYLMGKKINVSARASTGKHRQRQAGRRGHTGLHRSKETIYSRDGYHD